MRNIQERRIHAPAQRLGELMAELATPDDRVWPSPAWPRLRLDAGLTPGSRGGHGPIRYHVAEYEPGRRLRFAFDPRIGLDGHHELLIVPEGPHRCRLVHTVAGRCGGAMVLLWPLVIRWLHEALVQDLFDNAELAATGRPPTSPARWSARVRLLRRARGLPATRSRSATPA
ncbi:hypothetical protein CLV92_104221 [Kineococcus xinjiangensis]|uniref:Polyketide cyclase/dehydrase/lipid transport protein n=1 Tax=Kineococcus xinjiangensis TaxID=512762 RepID=A0A2S6IT95_9ACTN|nr:SRPBCC family protein [Kineococcus xinjiangensis]PPK97400.1 hypothetical protein CLV92_104221 [Kineococcus xinjiangensis]